MNVDVRVIEVDTEPLEGVGALRAQSLDDLVDVIHHDRPVADKFSRRGVYDRNGCEGRVKVLAVGRDSHVIRETRGDGTRGGNQLGAGERVGDDADVAAGGVVGGEAVISARGSFARDVETH